MYNPHCQLYLLVSGADCIHLAVSKLIEGHVYLLHSAAIAMFLDFLTYVFHIIVVNLRVFRTGRVLSVNMVRVMRLGLQVAEAYKKAGAPEVEIVPIDMKSSESIDQLAKTLLAKHKCIDVLVNCAGIFPMSGQTPLEGL